MVDAGSKPPPILWPHLTKLLENAGHITVGYISPIEGAAVAADEHTLLATLVRQPGEPFDELIQRLDHAIGQAMYHGICANEIKEGRFELAVRR